MELFDVVLNGTESYLRLDQLVTEYDADLQGQLIGGQDFLTNDREVGLTNIQLHFDNLPSEHPMGARCQNANKATTAIQESLSAVHDDDALDGSCCDQRRDNQDQDTDINECHVAFPFVVKLSPAAT